MGVKSKSSAKWASQIAEYPLAGTVLWLISLLFSFVLPLRFTLLPGSEKDDVNEEAPLFPLISDVTIQQESSSQSEPHPCSTGLTTRLLPFKNAKGEIEWAFTDDLPAGSELEAFRMDTKHDKNDSILSPVTSNSSNNESIISDKKANFPQVSTPSSTASEDDKVKEDENDGEDLIHQCPHCDSSFKMRGYLTRHLKKHSADKAYKCPFHKSSVYKDENDTVHKCHATGGFSRRDTYKTHLKSRHFRYPKGTAIKDRTLSAGNCSMCGEWFENGEIWCEIHIEGGECKYLPAGFKGKSRIKNRLKKQLSRMLKEQKQMKKHSHASLDYQSPILGTPNSVNTPIPGSALYDYNNSPTLSISSSVGTNPYQHPQAFKGTPHHLMPISHSEEKFSLPEDQEDYDDEFCLDTDQLSQQVRMEPDLLQFGLHPMSFQGMAVPSYTS